MDEIEIHKIKIFENPHHKEKEINIFCENKEVRGISISDTNNSSVKLAIWYVEYV